MADLSPTLVTGAAGFIGFHLAERLLRDNHLVIGIDNLNSYYDPALKQARLDRLRAHDGFVFLQADIADKSVLDDVFAEHRPQTVVNLAAQAGVRHSLTAPHDYIEANVTGFLNLLEAARRTPPAHLIFASTSSVFGLDSRMPLSVHRGGNHPISLYAATKKANEAMAHSYAHLFRIPLTGLRFFTVYGPWGRPDMALFKFTKAILAGRPVELYNHGKMVRDFTYVDDIVESIMRLMPRPPSPDPAFDPTDPDPAISSAPYRICNIGNSSPVDLMVYLRAIETALDRRAEIDYLPMQPGDVAATFADTADLERLTGFRPQTSVEEGVRRFVEWYRDFYGC